MIDDDPWEENSVKGFQFDFDEPEITSNCTQILPDSLNDAFDEENILDTIVQCCAICHNRVMEIVLYEKGCLFCSEVCWRRAVKTALEDFIVGGVSAWPIDTFWSYSSRSLLLQLATQCCDGDLIVKILQQMRRSLADPIFKKLLNENHIAYNHFINFLRNTGQNHILKECLSSWGDIQNAELLTFKEILKDLSSHNSTEVRAIAERLRNFTSGEHLSQIQLKKFGSVTAELVEILEDQITYNAEWNFLYKEICSSTDSKNAARMLPVSLIFQPLAETIAACVRMDNSVGIHSRADYLKSKYKVTDELFKWFVIEPLVQIKNWDELDHVILKKKILNRRLESLLPPDRLAQHLNALKAPNHIIANYLKLSSDTDEIIRTALRLNMYEEVVSLCAKNHDVSMMRNLLSQLPNNHPTRKQITKYILTPVNQWKDLT